MALNPLIGFILSIALGLYLINFGFGFIAIPAAFAGMDKIVITLAGVLLIFGGFNYFRIPRVRY